MVFDVYRVRLKGWVMPRFRSCMLRPVRGVLQVRDQFDEELHRSTRVATIVDRVSGAKLDIPPLFDANLVRAESDYMTLTGFERLPDESGLSERTFSFAQSWMLELASDEPGRLEAEPPTLADGQ